MTGWLSKLQQCLPFTVLKLKFVAVIFCHENFLSCNSAYRLRYWNPFGRTKTSSSVLSCNSAYRLRYWNYAVPLYGLSRLKRCNSAYRLRYWNSTELLISLPPLLIGCNSAYRLRYWNWSLLTDTSNRPLKVATVLTVYGIETRISLCREYIWIICVATVLTVYGIETQNHSWWWYAMPS